MCGNFVKLEHAEAVEPIINYGRVLRALLRIISTRYFKKSRQRLPQKLYTYTDSYTCVNLYGYG